MSEAYPVLASLSAGYPEYRGRLPTRYSPVRHSTRDPKIPFSFDLHVLSTPPAFVLSQDQTLQFNPFNRAPAFLTDARPGSFLFLKSFYFVCRRSLPDINVAHMCFSTIQFSKIARLQENLKGPRQKTQATNLNITRLKARCQLFFLGKNVAQCYVQKRSAH